MHRCSVHLPSRLAQGNWQLLLEVGCHARRNGQSYHCHQLLLIFVPFFARSVWRVFLTKGALVIAPSTLCQNQSKPGRGTHAKPIAKTHRTLVSYILEILVRCTT